MPCNRPRTKNLKRHFTFWPAPFLKAALKARSRNKRSDAHNYKTVAMGTPRVHSDQSLAWTAMVAPPADLRTVSARVGDSKRIHLSELSSFRTIEGACSDCSRVTRYSENGLHRVARPRTFVRIADNTLGAHGVASSSNSARPAHFCRWCSQCRRAADRASRHRNTIRSSQFRRSSGPLAFRPESAPVAD